MIHLWNKNKFFNLFLFVAAKLKNPRNEESDDVDIISVSGSNRLQFVHNDSSIIVTSFNEAEMATSDVISGLPSEAIEYQDHMDFIVKAVQEFSTTKKYLRIFLTC